MATGPLADKLRQETVAAMKAKDKRRLQVLRMLQAAVKQVEVDTREELDDAGLTRVFVSYAKKVKDALAGARESGRDDLRADAEAELEIVRTYLPAELEDAELDALLREVIAETGAASQRDMGAVMKAAMPRVAGRADGKRVSAAVKRLLAG